MGLGKLAVSAITDVMTQSFLSGSKVSRSIAKQFNLSSVEKVTKALNSASATKGNATISGDRLKLLPECFEPLFKGAKNPVANIHYKTGSKYNVAAVRLTDGDKVLATGAISVVKPGSAESVIKARLNVPDAVQANGYVAASANTRKPSAYSFGETGDGGKFSFLSSNFGTNVKLTWGRTYDRISNYFMTDKTHNAMYLFRRAEDLLNDNVKKFLGVN